MTLAPGCLADWSDREKYGDLRAEGTAAPAGGLGLWILDRKPRPLQAVHVVHLRTAQQRGALRVQDDLHVPLLDHRVIIRHLGLERHPVLIAVASAAPDVDPEPHGVLLFLDQFLNLALRH